MITADRTLAAAVLAVASLTTSSTHALLTQAGPADALAARIDPYVEKQRAVVMTDIANEPDDQMSMVRFLVYSNHFDVEGLIATTSTWMKNKVRPDVLQMLVGAYEEVRPRLLRHQPGFPPADALRAAIVAGQPDYGMAAVGPDRMSPGAELIIRAAEHADARPLWVLAWGGTNAGTGVDTRQSHQNCGAARGAGGKAARLQHLGSGRAGEPANRRTGE